MTSSLFSTVESNKVNPAKKPKLLVVDDEQDNLDLLYRTFRREFTVFRADGGIKALEILAKEGEMAAIISDQRMPEMNGTEFLSRTVSDFPDTMRIVLTGYTDITDLIDAINSGQVHKYITKPWEPDQLKLVVSEATQTYDVLKQRSEELIRSQAQNALLSVIVQIAQQSDRLDSCVMPLADAFCQNFGADGAIMQLVEQGALSNTHAKCGHNIWDLASDPLVQQAISTGKSQISLDADGKTNSAQPCKTSVVIAITFRDEVLGILALGWQDANAVSLGDIAAIQQCADEVAIALTCIRFYAKL
ncbi:MULTISPECIES: response regulator [Pseudanabaena]|uniref:Response regulator receiver modulated GAF sensor protein n=2 Tax=Pseudanabaena TaxID=1152 RepID=L8MY40_9CYAN|nr:MULTISPECIES: response regulator [Pseudanabaena]ELS32922.1 response regulator receiver modulated GAF sensor protein [Pseudanabaena biceps PCC 7429]MDG3494849.1 response regulator [Pseudanabaena catenata USMAC16]